MTDEELIARLHKIACHIAADRIEALVKDAKAQEKEIANLGDNLDAQKRRAERLEAAGKAYREATRHLKPCPETSAGFDAALKGVKT